MNPADRVREAFERWGEIYWHPDSFAPGALDRDQDGGYYNTAVEYAWRAWQAALALPVEPAKPDEVGMARVKVIEAAKDWHLATWNEDDYADALVRAVDALLAAERAAKEG